MELDYHFVCEKAALGLVTTRYVPTTQQLADILTKALSHDAYEVFRFKLGVQAFVRPSLKGHVEGADAESDSNYSPTLVLS